MNLRVLSLVGIFVVLVAAGSAQDTRDAPLLTGDDPQAVTPRTMETIRSLIDSMALPADKTRIWMLCRKASLAGDQHTKFVSLEAFLGPRLFTPRLIRGDEVLCNTFIDRNPFFPDAPIVDGLTLTNHNAVHYAFVAPADHPFVPTGPFEEPFTLWGFDLPDEEVVAIADVVRRLHPEKRLVSVNGAVDFRNGHYVALHVKCGCVDRKPDKDGNYADWNVELEKEGSEWSLTKIEDWSSLEGLSFP